MTNALGQLAGRQALLEGVGMRRGIGALMVLVVLSLATPLAEPAFADLPSWNLAEEFRVDAEAENPNRDSYGNPGVWSFMKAPNASQHNPSSYALLQHFYPDECGYQDIDIWGDVEAGGLERQGPSFALNHSGGTFTCVQGQAVPDGTIFTHPLQTVAGVVGWKSPISGNVAVTGGVSDDDARCGDGIRWSVDVGTTTTSTTLASGAFGNGGSQLFSAGTGGSSLGSVTVSKGSLIYFIVESGAASNFFCDLTGMDLKIDALELIPPDPPLLTGTDPASPANANSPKVIGDADSGSTVDVYASSDCSGDPVASADAETLASPGIPVAVADNSTTELSAIATDWTGLASECSNTLSFVEDSSAPSPPELSGTDPASKANDNNPEVQGSAPADSTIRLYITDDCSGPAGATGTSAQLSSPGITMQVADDTSIAIRATATDAAGNASDCSASIGYIEDSTAPAAPSLTSTDPVSPSSSNDAAVRGNAESGAFVRVYRGESCSGDPVGSSEATPDFSIQTSVTSDATTVFRASATDAAGNVSSCSDSISYVEDSTAPAAPTITDADPDSPANENNPKIKGTAEPGSTVRLYNGSCANSVVATGTAAEFASPGLAISVADNVGVAIFARATDAAGNLGPCSADPFVYAEDSTPPGPPTLGRTFPLSPANENNPVVWGTAPNNSTVRLYTTPDCSGAAVATGTATEFGFSGFRVEVADDATYVFRGTATDASGNTSICSAPLTYVEKSTVSAPTLTDTDPDSPANDNSPRVKGNAEPGSTVSLYTSADCSGTAVATGTADELASPGITINVADETTTTLSATATDTAGNTSNCSAPITYVEDSSPGNPCDGKQPTIIGTEAGETIIGTTNPDVIDAGGGSDMISGLGGADVICGGDGADTIAGGNGNDALIGGAQDDLLVGEGGNDRYVGNDGRDTVDFVSGPVSARIGGSATGEGSDTLAGVEDILGTPGGDHLRGDAGANRLDGGGGVDTLFTSPGADTFIGGQGSDIIDFSSRGALRIDLAEGTAKGDGTDQLRTIENVIGGSGPDLIIGNTESNRFDGRGGDDDLRGRGGSDKLFGEDGSDIMFGGTQIDLCDGGEPYGHDEAVGCETVRGVP
jgi:hypothetical protein